MPGSKRNVVVLSSDDEDHAPPPKKNSSTSTRYQQGQREDPELRIPTQLHTTHPRLNAGDNPLLPRGNGASLLESQKQTKNVLKARTANGEGDGDGDGDGDGGSRVRARANENGHILAERIVVGRPSALLDVNADQIDLTSSQDQDRYSSLPSPEKTVFSFKKYSHRHRMYRHRHSEEEHEDSANNMLSVSPETRPPPSAGLLPVLDSDSPSRSPKSKDNPEQRPQPSAGPNVRYVLLGEVPDTQG